MGALEKNQQNRKTLAKNVEIRLTDSLTDCLQRNHGYNIITDNFFTTAQVAALLQRKEITLVGTDRANSKGLPEEITGSSKKDFLASFLQCW